MSTLLVDKNLICAGCKNKFLFTKEEQDLFLRKCWPPPFRCPDCRRKIRREKRDKRQSFLKAMRAAETVKVEITPSPVLSVSVEEKQASPIDKGTDLSASNGKKKREKKSLKDL